MELILISKDKYSCFGSKKGAGNSNEKQKAV